MKSVVGHGCLCCGAVLLCLGVQGQASAAGDQDPRVGLKAGSATPGRRAQHLELVASLPKPEGFFDPKRSRPETRRRRPEAATELPSGTDRDRRRRRPRSASWR